MWGIHKVCLRHGALLLGLFLAFFERLHFFTMTGAVGVALWYLSVEYGELGKTTA